MSAGQAVSPVEDFPKRQMSPGTNWYVSVVTHLLSLRTCIGLGGKAILRKDLRLFNRYIGKYAILI
jgi:hypothetical protein